MQFVQYDDMFDETHGHAHARSTDRCVNEMRTRMIVHHLRLIRDRKLDENKEDYK